MDSTRDHVPVPRGKILVVAPRVAASFVRQDAELLSHRFDTRLIQVRGITSVKSLFAAVRRADAIVMWFVGRHSVPSLVFARVLGVPLITVIGGFEVAWVPELEYGIQPGSMKEHILEQVLSASTLVLSVSDYSYNDAVARFPGLRQRFRTVPNAVDTDRFRPIASAKREGVISVGAINSETIGRKSWGLFIETARKLGDVPFKMVGPATDSEGHALVRDLPANVTWIGEVDHGDLVPHLQRASVYLQLSVYESFCLSLAEAMSCGCLPVVSKLGALPEVAGETGTLLQSLSPDIIEAAIRRALVRAEADRLIVRDRIVTQYSTERRLELLTEILNEVLSIKRP